MLQDARYGIRSLTKTPGFTIVAVVVLALGIGINTALFSIVYSVFFRPLPVHAPQELVYLYWITGITNRRPMVMPYEDFAFFRDHAEAFTDLTAHWGNTVRFTADGETDMVRGERVFANYFELLGVKPVLGRTFRPEEDDLTNADLAVVISHSLWQRRFQGDPSIIGKQVRLHDWNSEKHFTVIGVTGPEFRGVSEPWTPSQWWVTFAQGRGDEFRRFGSRRISVAPIGRLKRGVTLAQARSIVATQGEQIKKLLEHRETTQYVALAANSVRMPFDPTASVVPTRVAATLTMVVATVLLIATANITGMLLARGVGRASEMALRLVLGATGRRLVRQLLIESLLLAMLGGVLGLFSARWLLALFRAYTPNRYAVDVVMDVRVLFFTAIICVGVGLLIGLAPALRAAKIDLRASLPGSGIGVTKNVRGRLRHWVVIPQVALSLVLLLVAGLYVRALMKIELADLGYRTENVVVLSTGLRTLAGEDNAPDQRGLAERRAERSRKFYQQMLAGFAGIPGAADVSLTSRLPVHEGSRGAYTAVAQEDFLAGNSNGAPAGRVGVAPGYFRTLGMSLPAGRDFDERDTRATPRVAIISEGLARRLWPGRNAIDRFIATRNNFPGPNEKIEWLEIVGVVNEVDPILQDRGQDPLVYLPLGQEWYMTASSVVARVRGDQLLVVQRLKQAIAAADLFAEVYRVQTMHQVVSEILYPRRLAAAILSASGLIGLLLASIGLYGVVSYSVAQRVQEIGIRAALGAERADIMSLVIREGMQVALVGSLLGFVLTYTALRATSNIVVALPAMDVPILVGVPLLLGAVILLACYLPARRAAHVDPMVALRQL